MWLACRHHVFEVIASDVWKVFFGDTKSPVNMPFKALQNNWDKIKKRASTNRLHISTTFPWLALLKQHSICLLNMILHDSLKGALLVTTTERWQS